MSLCEKIVNEIAEQAMAAVTEDDAERVTREHFAVKVKAALACVLDNCRCGPQELLNRCSQPGRRELIQVKHAVRSVLSEQEGEDVAYNYVRNYEVAIRTAISLAASNYTPKEIVNALVEAGYLPASLQ
jgi:hypothetical protein